MRELAHAFRMLRRNPGFTLIVVLTLALGIGVNTGIFSVVDAVMLKPLPYPHPEQLVAVMETDNKGRGNSISPANIADYNQNHVLTGVVHVSGVGMNLTGGEPERLSGIKTTYNFFSSVGVAPTLGRGFLEEEDRFAGRNVVVLSDDLWHRRFGADPRILGTAIRLDDQAYTVVGVMPPHFQVPFQFLSKLPISLFLPSAFPPDLLTNRGDHEDHAFARLAPGVALQQAQAEMTAIAARLAKAYPKTNGDQTVLLSPLRTQLTDNIRTPLLILLAAVGLVLLIACANVANLLLARGAAQAREVSIRAALGAGRGRIVRELLVQAGVLATAGCLAGLLAAYGVCRALIAYGPRDIPRLASASLDPTVLAYAAALAIVTVLLFGLFPAWVTSGAVAREGFMSARQALANRVPLRSRAVLTAAEVALSLVLLIGSGLLLKSFVLVSHVDLGFAPDHVVAMDLNLSDTKYPDAKRRLAFFQDLSSRISHLPGVAAVTYGRLPMRGHWISVFEKSEQPVVDPSVPGPQADFQMVSPGYFQTLQVGLRAGRPFTNGDADGKEPVVIVNEALVQRYYPGGDALGHRIRRIGSPAWRTIVGIVGPVHLYGQSNDIDPQIYLPATQTDSYPMAIAGLAFRTRQDPLKLVQAVRREVWAIDKDQPINNVQTYRELVSDSLAQRRFQTMLLSAFASLALLLALVGIYGVMAYLVEQRTAEIGVRVAIGAQRRDVLALVMGQALRLTIGGLVVGIPAAYAATRLLRSLLYKVEPFDPWTFVTLALLATGAALLASYVPARRATRIDPMAALRED
jgi:putative ABC transport system permease protein